MWQKAYGQRALTPAREPMTVDTIFDLASLTKVVATTPAVMQLVEEGRLRLADLFLDTNPYNAHTTASDALWAGCPVLTVPGATFASRVAGSLNHHLGLDAMNVDGDEAFVRHAVGLATTPGALSALRSELASRRDASPLFDMPGFAADFSALLRRMAERHRTGLPPATLEPQPA